VKTERGRFSHAGGASHQHVAAPELGDVRQHAGEIEIFEGLDLEGDHSQYDVEEASLSGDVDAEAPLAGEFEGEVSLVEIEILTLWIDFDELPGDRLGVVGRQNLVPELHEIAVKAVQRQIAHLEVDV